jgi:hypothetical protein
MPDSAVIVDVFVTLQTVLTDALITLAPNPPVAEALKVMLVQLTLEERSRIWHVVQQPFRCSVTYGICVVNLELLEQRTHVPVRVRQLDPRRTLTHDGLDSDSRRAPYPLPPGGIATPIQDRTSTSVVDQPRRPSGGAPRFLSTTFASKTVTAARLRARNIRD